MIKPKVTADVVKKAAADADKALSGPVTLNTRASRPGCRSRPSPRTCPSSPTTRRHEPAFDASSAIATVEKNLVDPSLAPREPTFQIVAGKPKLIPGHNGRGIDAKKLAGDVAKMVTQARQPGHPGHARGGPAEGHRSEARGLGIKENVSEFTTPFDCCLPRVTNIQRIAQLLDGHLVKPGETFSLNGVIGQRDTARGFVPAADGHAVGWCLMGGGISQFVTTMYNAAFFGGFEDV